jgi:hypothetical protein
MFKIFGLLVSCAWAQIELVATSFSSGFSAGEGYGSLGQAIGHGEDKQGAGVVYHAGNTQENTTSIEKPKKTMLKSQNGSWVLPFNENEVLKMEAFNVIGKSVAIPPYEYFEGNLEIKTMGTLHIVILKVHTESSSKTFLLRR